MMTSALMYRALLAPACRARRPARRTGAAWFRSGLQRSHVRSRCDGRVQGL